MAKVLMIEDSHDSADVLVRLLASMGHEIDWAPDGQYALEYVAEEVPDLIILDLSMPGMDGLEVLERLRADPRFADRPIVVFTAIQDPGTRERAMAAGATDFWVKGSFDFKSLGERIDGLLARSLA